MSELKHSGHFIHGFSNKEKLYGVWKSMRQRCRDPKHNRSKYYLEKGIRICEEWNSYSAFRDWAIRSGYNEGLSIDRINPDGNYEPNNCRWATPKTQSNNQTRNKRFTIGGETKTMAEWAEVAGIPKDTMKRRIYKGWSIEKAITTPVREHKPYGST